MYQQTSESAAGDGGRDQGAQGNRESRSSDDDVVDAEFEEVKDDDKK
jgi:molecular chaperone DnaK